ncbi:MAG: HAMP domain-containing protein [Spirochaetales bacterium]|nr:HAMP domain-containing protein [Spirochaetales bacterium]
MKLYTKTLLLIIILIISQAALTAGLVIRITSANNTEDARLELERESSLVIDSFNSWKRHLWKQLIRINEFMAERELATVKEADISTLLLSTNVDAVIVKTQGESFNIQTISTSEEFILPPSEDLEVFYTRPYIGMYYAEENLYLAGVTSLESDKGTFNVILLKHINGSFLKNLVFDTGGRVIFHTADRILTGNAQDNTIIFDHNLATGDNSYFEYYDLNQETSSWNLSIRKCGTLGNPEGTGKVFLTTLLSNGPYKRRILNIERSFLNVSLVIIFLTSLLSLQISRSITQPINRLLSAMEAIRGGSLDVHIPAKAQDEVGRLLNGFNEMAHHLRQDQKQINESMDEILFLNKYNEQVFNSIRDSIAVVDGDTKIEKANDFFTAGFLEGKEAPLKLADLNSSTFDATVIENITNVLSGAKDFWTQRIRNPESVVYELKVYPLGSEQKSGSNTRRCILLLEDISQKVEYEEKIYQAEKLSSLSMLSAGIAHEVNNPLSSILSNVQNLIYDEKDPEKKELMVLIEDETRRIANIIRDLMEFTSQDQETAPVSDPLAIGLEVCKLLKHSAGKVNGNTPEIIVHHDGKIPMTAISTGELMQIYINLVQNGLHATGLKGPVTMNIEGNEDDEMVTLSISDQGCGIETANIPRVFDPFYTTKSNGEGTGLGLSVVYGIIKKYDGEITISSNEGSGTEVKFRLHKA